MSKFIFAFATIAICLLVVHAMDGEKPVSRSSSMSEVGSRKSTPKHKPGPSSASVVGSTHSSPALSAQSSPKHSPQNAPKHAQPSHVGSPSHSSHLSRPSSPPNVDSTTGSTKPVRPCGNDNCDDPNCLTLMTGWSPVSSDVDTDDDDDIENDCPCPRHSCRPYKRSNAQTDTEPSKPVAEKLNAKPAPKP